MVFRRCRILGWQDTIKLDRGRQWLVECYISGHVDFIYGGATAYFERCEIFCQRPKRLLLRPPRRGKTVGFMGECLVTPYAIRSALGRPTTRRENRVLSPSSRNVA